MNRREFLAALFAVPVVGAVLRALPGVAPAADVSPLEAAMTQAWERIGRDLGAPDVVYMSEATYEDMRITLSGTPEEVFQRRLRHIRERILARRNYPVASSYASWRDSLEANHG